MITVQSPEKSTTLILINRKHSTYHLYGDRLRIGNVSDLTEAMSVVRAD